MLNLERWQGRSTTLFLLALLVAWGLPDSAHAAKTVCCCTDWKVGTLANGLALRKYDDGEGNRVGAGDKCLAGGMAMLCSTTNTLHPRHPDYEEVCGFSSLDGMLDLMIDLDVRPEDFE